MMDGARSFCFSEAQNFSQNRKTNKKIVQMLIPPLDIIGDVAYNNIIPGRKEVNR